MEEYLLVSDHPINYPEKLPVLERLLHCIWSEQLFRKTLLVEGKTLLISSPGWWNLEAGPDFKNAEIFLDGRRISGDVEIHLSSGDWYQHRHHRDLRYNDVILHVVLYKSETCFKENGEEIPQLEMKDQLAEELQLLQKKIPIYQFPFSPTGSIRLCRRFLEEHPPESVERILDSAGDLRMQRKKDQYLEVIQRAGFGQAFYEGMMEGMGYKQSRFAFRELAHRVCLKELLSYDHAGTGGVDTMSAILLGTAGLLSDFSAVRLFAEDPETGKYVQRLVSEWYRCRKEFGDRILSGFCWYPSSTRPANFPARRLTAVAAFLHTFGTELLPFLLQPIQRVDREKRLSFRIRQFWIKGLTSMHHFYWSYHYQFERRKFFRPKRLIGIERGKILVINVLVPVLLAYAEAENLRNLEEILQHLYHTHPRLSDNSITRLMEYRLFGGRKQARFWVRTAHRQQALHHFFYDFCDNREASCSRCSLQESGPHSDSETEASS